jgi:hypothetical protein
MEITLVKAARAGDRDRAWLTAGGATRRGAIHVVHDLPHLVVESLFGITNRLWAELAAGDHTEAGHAAAARDPGRKITPFNDGFVGVSCPVAMLWSRLGFMSTPSFLTGVDTRPNRLIRIAGPR